MFLFSLDEVIISVYAYTICVELLYLAFRGLIGFFYLPVLAYKYHTRPYILREFIPTSSSYVSLKDNNSRSVVAPSVVVAGGPFFTNCFGESVSLSSLVSSPVVVAGGNSFAGNTSKTSSRSSLVASSVFNAGGIYGTTGETSKLSSAVVSPVAVAGGVSLAGKTSSISSVVVSPVVVAGSNYTTTSETGNFSSAVAPPVAAIITTVGNTSTNNISNNRGEVFSSWRDTAAFLPGFMPCKEDIDMKDASPLLEPVSSSLFVEEDIEMLDAPPLLDIASNINTIDAGDLVCSVSLCENTNVTSNALLERSSGVSFFCFGKKTLPKRSWIKSGFIKKGSRSGVSRHFARVVGDVCLPGQTIYSINPGSISYVSLKNEDKEEQVVEEISSLESVTPLVVPSVVPTPTLPAKRVMDSVPAEPAAKRGVLVEAAVVSNVDTAAVPVTEPDMVQDVPTMISPSAPSRPVRTPSLRLEQYKKKYSLKTTVFEEYKQKEKTVAEISALFDEAEEEEERKEEEKKKKGKGRYSRFNL